MTIFLQNFALQATKLCTKICILILCEHALTYNTNDKQYKTNLPENIVNNTAESDKSEGNNRRSN